MSAASTPTHPPTPSFKGTTCPVKIPFPLRCWVGGQGGEEALPPNPVHTRHREGVPGDPGDLSARSCPLLPEAWKKELKDLASRVAIFTKESELKSKEVGAEQRSCSRRNEMDPLLCN